jgi:hypothetical protein
MKFRPLTRREVAIKVVVSPEDRNDPEYIALPELLRVMAETGHEWPWCSVVVTAEWRGLEGSDRSGCLSFASEEEFRASRDFADMVERAMIELNSQCSRMLALLASHSEGKTPPIPELSREQADFVREKISEGYPPDDSEIGGRNPCGEVPLGPPREVPSPEALAEQLAGEVLTPPPPPAERISPEEQLRRQQLNQLAERSRKALEESGTAVRANADPDQPIGNIAEMRRICGRSVQIRPEAMVAHLRAAHELVMRNVRKSFSLEKPPAAIMLGESALAANYALIEARAALMANPGRVKQEPKAVTDLQEAADEALERAARMLAEYVMPGSVIPE